MTDSSPQKKSISLSRSTISDSGFLNAGLIKRHKGKYMPTMLGNVVYESQMVIEEALSHYWELKVIDQIEIYNSDLPTDEVTRLINAHIDNYRIKDFLMKTSDMKFVNK